MNKVAYVSLSICQKSHQIYLKSLWPSRAQAEKKASRLNSFAEQSQYPYSSRNLSAGQFELRAQRF